MNSRFCKLSYETRCTLSPMIKHFLMPFNESKTLEHSLLLYKVIKLSIKFSKNNCGLTKDNLKEIKRFVFNFPESISQQMPFIQKIFEESQIISFLILLMIRKGIHVLKELGLKCFQDFALKSFNDFTENFPEIHLLIKDIHNLINEYLKTQKDLISEKLDCLVATINTYSNPENNNNNTIIFAEVKQVVAALYNYFINENDNENFYFLYGVNSRLNVKLIRIHLIS